MGEFSAEENGWKVDAECPVTDVPFTWTTRVPSDQIIICPHCGGNHVLGEIGSAFWLDPDEGWKFDTTWKVEA
jgi:hypothetical protein